MPWQKSAEIFFSHSHSLSPPLSLGDIDKGGRVVDAAVQDLGHHALHITLATRLSVAEGEDGPSLDAGAMLRPDPPPSPSQLACPATVAAQIRRPDLGAGPLPTAVHVKVDPPIVVGVDEFVGQDVLYVARGLDGVLAHCYLYRGQGVRRWR